MKKDMKGLLDFSTLHSSTVRRLVLNFTLMKTQDIISFILTLPNLTHLSVISGPPILTFDIEEIVNHLPSQLVSLDLHVDHLLSHYGPYDCQHMCLPSIFFEVFIQQLTKKCPNLNILDLDGFVGSTVRGLDNLLLANNALSSLSLTSHVIGWLEVEKIFKCCKHLKHLSLVSSRLIENTDTPDSSSDNHDERMRRVRRYKRKAIQLAPSGQDLESCFPASLCSIRLYSSPHRSVPLELDPFAGLIRGRGHQLQHLHGHYLFNASWHIISIWCGNLLSLDLSYHNKPSMPLTEVEEVVLCGLPRLLRKLQRVALPVATDRILVEFGHFCPDLKELRFQGFGFDSNKVHEIPVTDRGVVALAEGCSALKVLNLAGCKKITISSVRALSFHCSSLKVLILNGCHMLGTKGFLGLLRRLIPSLLLLDITNTKIELSTLKNIVDHLLVHGSTLRVLAIPSIREKSLHEKFLQLKQLLPSLSIRQRSSGIHWDGFHHASSLVEL